MQAVKSYMADHVWDEVVLLGDLMDFDLISSHNKDNLRATSGKLIRAEYDYGNNFLDELQAVAPKAKFALLEGNHDERIERYINANPQLEGMLEMEQGLQLRKRKIKWVRFWTQGELYRIGKARFIHGLYTTKYHASKHAEAFGDNIFYGHTHDVQSHSKELQGDDKTIVAQSLGCLCRYNQKYMKGKPSKWQQAFGVFYFFPDGHFQYYVIRTFKHRFFSPEGKLYEG